MAKTFIERIEEDIRRAEAGERILSEEPDFVLLRDDSGIKDDSKFIPVSKSHCRP